jgi:hypothetical protein
MLSYELLNAYKNEALAVEAFKEYRLKKGVVCKKCGCTHQYWLAPKQQFQCKACRFRTTLRSGTVLEGSKLPVSYFFIAVHLLLKKGNGLTTEEFQKQTSHKYYEPLWDFLRKIKNHLNEGEKNVILIDFLEVIYQYFIKVQVSQKEQEINLAFYETDHYQRRSAVSHV